MSNGNTPSDRPGIGQDSSWVTTARRWLDALNSFLERAYHQADVETGC